MKKTKLLLTITVFSVLVTLLDVTADAQKVSSTESIRPFRVNIPDAALKELRTRIMQT